MTSYTPEPWTVTENLPSGSYGPSLTIRKDRQIVIASLTGSALHNGQAPGNARRIVACVNACAGIPTEALEGGAVSDAMKALQAMANVQSSRRHPLGQPDEGIAYNAAQAMSWTLAALAKLRGEG